MESTVTIRLRSIVLALVALVGLLAAFVVGATVAGAGQTTSPPAAAAAPAAEDPRTIVMSGAGEATGVPDQLAFRISVETRAADVSAALARSNGTMRRVQTALRELDVRWRDMQTAGLDLWPVYDYSGNGPGVIVGYAVSQDLGVLVRDFANAGRALAASVEAGGNDARVHGLRLQIGDVDALQRQARKAAVAEATAKARQYAEATGQRLGDVLTVREVSFRRPAPVPVYAARAIADEAFGKVPVRAGSSELTVRVSVTWAFE